MQRAVDWLLAMQSKDGGWAAFDVDNNWHFLSSVPFADHNAMLDPTCPDITGRVLEALCACGVRTRPSGHAARRRVSEADPGSRRKLVRTLGRRLHLRHVPGAARLASRGRKRSRSVYPARRRMAALDSERRRRLGRKLRQLRPATLSSPRHSTPSQTAWAILGLLAGGDTTSSSLHKGVEYLIGNPAHATAAGTRSLSTGTGFPGVFYLQYHLYRHSFPVLALSSYLKAKGADGADRS